MFRKPRKDGREMSVTPAMHSRMAKKVALRPRQHRSAPASMQHDKARTAKLRRRGAPGRLLLDNEWAQHGSPDGRCKGQHHRVVQRQQNDRDQVCSSPTTSACESRSGAALRRKHMLAQLLATWLFTRTARARTVHDGAVPKNAPHGKQATPAAAAESQHEPVHTKRPAKASTN